MEYTKGNWIVRGKQPIAYSGYHIWDDTQGILTKDVAIVYPNPQGKSDFYGETNARLVASAPDLYEACKLSLDALQHHVATFNSPYADTAEQALIGAIAKAEG